MTTANPLRGEADARIGSIKFRIAVSFDGLARLSAATGVRTMQELYVRMLGFEPKMVACAVRCLIIADDDDKVAALSARILDPSNISGADEEAWRESVEKALEAHISAGKLKRDERTAAEIAETALLGEPLNPS